jgi:hypothetical protein
MFRDINYKIPHDPVAQKDSYRSEAFPRLRMPPTGRARVLMPGPYGIEVRFYSGNSPQVISMSHVLVQMSPLKPEAVEFEGAPAIFPKDPTRKSEEM